MSIRQDLIALREHLTPRENWTQGSWARSHAKRRFPKEKFYVLPTDPETDQWCLVGGVAYVTQELPFCWTDRSFDIFDSLAGDDAVIRHQDAMDFLISWNDWEGRTHAEVLRRIDEAIARLPKGAEDFSSWLELLREEREYA